MNKRAPNVRKLLLCLGAFVLSWLINEDAFAQDYDARIDVTFIKADSSETRYLSLINYSNQPIELYLTGEYCKPDDEINILSIKDSSVSLGWNRPGAVAYYGNFYCFGFSDYSRLLIAPFSVLITPINEPKNKYADEVYFALIVSKSTSITLNNKKEEYGFPFKHVIRPQRKFYVFFTKPTIYANLHIFPFEVNVNSTLKAKSDFSQAINKTTVLGLQEYLSYFCE